MGKKVTLSNRFKLGSRSFFLIKVKGNFSTVKVNTIMVIIAKHKKKMNSLEDVLKIGFFIEIF